MSMIDFPLRESPGIVKDIEPYRLPPGAWTDGENVLFKDSAAHKAFGYAPYITSPTISPRALFFCPLRENGLWVYPGLAKVYAFDVSKTTADVTRAAGDYTGGNGNIWEFTYLHGMGIFTNGVDVPQQWAPSLANDLIALSNWPASTYCRLIRTFRNFLVALDITKSSGTRYPELVKWSHPADIGAVPSSWDETDATKDAGEFPLSKSPGIIVAAEMLGNSLIIYKEASVWQMSYVGGQLIFGFNEIFPSWGAFSSKSVVPCKKGHFVVTKDDVLLHNGHQAESIINSIDRQWLFDNIEFGAANFYTTGIYWVSRAEVWFFFPTTGSLVPNMALVWNEEKNSIVFREITALRAASYTPAMALSSGNSWDIRTDAWSAATDTWDDPTHLGVKERVLFADSVTDQIMAFDQTVFTDNSVAYTSFLERQGMAFVETAQDGTAIVEIESVKYFKEMWPRFTGSGTVTIQFAVQMNLNDAISWSTGVSFVIGTTQIVPINLSGRLLSVKIQETNSTEWVFHGFSYSVEREGLL